MIPLRHLAPEVLQSSSFSTASDVFACAVAVWEAFNCGALPFEATGNEEFIQMLQSNTIDYGQLFGNEKIPNELKETLVSKIEIGVQECRKNLIRSVVSVKVLVSHAK